MKKIKRFYLAKSSYLSNKQMEFLVGGETSGLGRECEIYVKQYVHRGPYRIPDNHVYIGYCHYKNREYGCQAFDVDTLFVVDDRCR